MPTVAGMAPASRTRRSDSTATARPRPAEKPCETSVVSSATTGRCRASAAATSSVTRVHCAPGMHSLSHSPGHGIAPIFDTARAAARNPSSTPPTR